jgi:hypothetical protein
MRSSSRKGKRQIKRDNSRTPAPHRYLIVCEGERTEPNYFNGIKNIIDRKFKNRIEVDIIGTGFNTVQVVEEAVKRRNSNPNPYSKVWCVFDRDDFPAKNFNDAISMCEIEGIHAAWSNESIELWFLLHFQFLDTGITRQDYIEKLKDIFTKKNINNGKYVKNMPEIHTILTTFGDQKSAIKHATKLRELFCNDKSFANQNPSTTIHLFVQELEEYL